MNASCPLVIRSSCQASGLNRHQPLRLFCGTFWTVMGISEFDQVFLTDRKGDMDPLPEEFALDFPFQHKFGGVAGHDKRGHWAGLTMVAFPGDRVIGVSVDQTTFFTVTATVIITIEITTINGTTCHQRKLLISP